jgi:hypothetical protein
VARPKTLYPPDLAVMTTAVLRVTEKVYRHQLRPVLLTGAVVMDHIFDGTLPGSPTLPEPTKRSGPRR